MYKSVQDKVRPVLFEVLWNKQDEGYYRNLQIYIILYFVNWLAFYLYYRLVCCLHSNKNSQKN